MLIRIMTAIVGMPIIIGAFYFGQLPLLAFVLSVIVIATKEYLKILAVLKIKIVHPFAYAFSIIFPLATYFNLASIEMLFVVTLLVIMSIYLVFYKQSLNDCAYQLFGIFYISGMFTYVLKLRAMENGFRYLLLTFLFIWMSDSGAYFIGKFFGKHKLAPLISPNKTIEGSLGGLMFTVLFAVILAILFKYPLYLMLALALVVNIFAQIGDLVESAIKRQANVKDSGALLPGHGGVLDRFDSAFFAVPAVYVLLGFL